MSYFKEKNGKSLSEAILSSAGLSLTNKQVLQPCLGFKEVFSEKCKYKKSEEYTAPIVVESFLSPLSIQHVCLFARYKAKPTIVL